MEMRDYTDLNHSLITIFDGNAWLHWLFRILSQKMQFHKKIPRYLSSQTFPQTLLKSPI